MHINRIVWHHTGGGYKPNATDMKSYPRLVNGDGEVVNGNHPILANSAGRKLTKGTYSPHTLNLNSGSGAISVCSMVGGVWDNPQASKAFPRPVQIDALIDETVRLCREFGVTPDREHVLSHAEVEPTLGVKQKNKWDFDYQIRKTGGRNPIAIGDELRQEVRLKLGSRPVVEQQAPAARPTIWQGATGPHVEALQRALGVKPDGAFGPKTRTAVAAFQKSRQLLPDGIVGRMTWAALGL